MKALDLPFKDKLYRFALNIVGNTFDAEDIMQELMIKIWNRMDQFKEIDNKEAWCMTVTRNMAIDKTRNKKTNVQDISDYHHLKDADDTPDKKLEIEAVSYTHLYQKQDFPDRQKQYQQM